MAGRGFRGANANIQFTATGLNVVNQSAKAFDKILNDVYRNTERLDMLNERMLSNTLQRQRQQIRLAEAQRLAAVTQQRLNSTSASNTLLIGTLTDRLARHNNAADAARHRISELGREYASLTLQVAATGTSTQRFLTLISRFGPTALAIGASVAAFRALQASMQFIADSVGVAANIQSMEAAFKGLTGSARDAKKVVADAFSTSLSFPVNPEQYLTGARTLLSVGENVERLNESMKLLSIVSTASKQPLSDISVIYGEIMNKNRMYREDLLQFSRRGIPIAQELAEQLGVSRDELNQMVTDGKITFDVFRQGLQSMAEGRFANLPSELMNTAAGQLEIMSNALMSIKNDVGGIILELSSPTISSTAEYFRDMARWTKDMLTTWKEITGNSIAPFRVDTSKGVEQGYKLTNSELETQVGIYKQLVLERRKNIRDTSQVNPGQADVHRRELAREERTLQFLENQILLREHLISLGDSSALSVDDEGRIKKVGNDLAETGKKMRENLAPSNDALNKWKELERLIKGSSESMAELAAEFDQVVRNRVAENPDMLQQDVDDLANLNEQLKLLLDKFDGSAEVGGIMTEAALRSILPQEEYLRRTARGFNALRLALESLTPELQANAVLNYIDSLNVDDLESPYIDLSLNESVEALNAPLRELQKLFNEGSREYELLSQQMRKNIKENQRASDAALIRGYIENAESESEAFVNALTNLADTMTEEERDKAIAGFLQDTLKEFKSQTFSSTQDFAKALQENLIDDKDNTAKVAEGVNKIVEIMTNGGTVNDIIKAVEGIRGRAG